MAPTCSVVVCFILFGLSCANRVEEIISQKVQLGQAIYETRYWLQVGFSNPSHLKEIDALEVLADNLHLSNNHQDFDLIRTSVSSFLPENSIAKRSTFINDAQGNSLTIFANYPRTSSYLATTPAVFLNQLVGGENTDYMEKFVNLYSSFDLTSHGISQDDMDRFLLSTMVMLQNQTVKDPVYFVSHGTDHAVRDSMAIRYDCERNTSCLFILMLNGLLHDTGYIDISQYDVPKWVHAISSMWLALDLLNADNLLGQRIIAVLCNNNPSVVPDFLMAIRTHNFDDQACVNRTCKGNITPYLKEKFEADPAVRGYTEPEPAEQPMAFMIRISDNLDAMRVRLTDFQRATPVITFYCYLYTNQSVRSDKNFNMSAARVDAFARVVKLFHPYQEETIDSLYKWKNYYDYESFLHFYSTWMVDTLDVAWVNGSLNVRIGLETPDVTTDDHDPCSNLQISEHPGPSLYQVNRFAVSMHSLRMNAKPFVDLVKVTVNNGFVPGACNETHPLASFTVKATYNTSGNQDGKICDDLDSCYAANRLTNSPEQCASYVDKKIQFSACNPGKSSWGLSFAKSYSSCTAKPSPKVKLTPVEIAAIVISVVIATALIVIMVLCILRRSKNSEQDPEPSEELK